MNRKDNIDAIKEELGKGQQEASNVPSQCGMFNIRSANQTMKEAALRPNPRSLWKEFWYEGEISCLFADSGNGKSIYAVQIATQIAEHEKVLYFDFELSDKQFQLRYTDEAGHLHGFPPNLYRVEINPEDMDVSESFEDAVVANIESAAIQTGSKVLIIDNLTWLCNNSEKGDMAGRLMMKLNKLKKKYEWSLLVLAHTPKRPLTSPITQNDLAGSKKLYNFFDSAFTIGLSAKDPSLRYVKQVKVRYGAFTYDSNNVMDCHIAKDGSFLRFEILGFSSERDHLKEPSKEDVEKLAMSVKELSGQGKSIRDIGKELGISKSKVERILKK